ncbi:MAG TPA: UDP-N-acetylmuramoyl-tripeptide--D-alanyl-D-alanine ligase [Bacteroidales bacterium]|nr:UDP-N-acetylmuramoyl-tripeptide--D-alanyl-D-alanine ligase [Bacteroidales bacterium]
MELEALCNLVRTSEGICTDSRTIKKGEVFFALRGPNHDGNLHATAAIAAGARAAVVDDPSLSGDNIFVVPDVLSALQQTALYYRKSLAAPVIAITGTNGKTTTKELIREVLSKKYSVHATEGNLNNHIGVPVTLLKAPTSTQMFVIEMGANHPGEIAALCDIARPTHGLITNIGKAHLEGFGSFDGVIAAKSELYHFLRDNCGIAFYNEQDKLLSDLIFKIVHKALPYSDPSGTDLKVEENGDNVLLSIKAEYHNETRQFKTNLFGHHNLDNVRAAMAVGIFFDVPLTDIIDAIQNYKPGNNRSQVLRTNNNTIICDSYNANPSSMIRALASFSGMKCQKKMVILGDMLELGTESLNEHQTILDGIRKLGVEEALFCGPVFTRVASGKQYRCFENSNALKEYLTEAKPSGYAILVKGSRGMALEKIYDVL